MDKEKKKLFAEADNLVIELQNRVIEGKADPTAIMMACTKLGIQSMIAFEMDDGEIINALCEVLMSERARHNQYLQKKGGKA